MTPQTKYSEADLEGTRLQEHFAEQIEDTSLPAAQVLTEQQDSHEAEDAAPLFVP
ncbi:MAG TPA: hypothetical protein VHM28_10305 [Anaerolineales bacterium]|jgi:hypothetical protein|nr:hypothetical protein [Anaerolineales bacterium]